MTLSLRGLFGGSSGTLPVERLFAIGGIGIGARLFVQGGNRHGTGAAERRVSGQPASDNRGSRDGP